eukprot:1193296-Prorocentrum_minimum.AAC.3
MSVSSPNHRRVGRCVGGQLSDRAPDWIRTETNHRGVNGYIPAWGPITGESTGIYLRGDQSQGSRRVYTCVGTDHRGVHGYILAWGPITWESTGIYLRGDRSQGSRR